MGTSKTLLYSGLVILIVSLLLSVFVFSDSFLVPLFTGVVGVIAVFFTIFERRNVGTETIVLIAILSSLAAVGRVIFASIPSVQPSSFIIIVTGMVFGPQVGFLTGSICALVSNFVLGQGPWTLWQVFCWGSMGFLSGVLTHILRKNMLFRVTYGLVWGLVFGFIMNLWFLLTGYTDTLNMAAVFTAMSLSFTMDISHGIFNAVLLFFLGDKFLSVFGRIAAKYGLEGGKMV